MNRLDKMVAQAIKENPDAIADYKAGMKGPDRFLLGVVMRISKGTVNPKMALRSIKTELDKL
jgi:Asp-tRNA(Asn)/Glu-tRNA(Gln) amidotransferase B subunit